jgi:hypothetical protein
MSRVTEEADVDSTDVLPAESSSTLRRRYVGGATELRGTSAQQITQEQWQGECDEFSAVTLCAYLVARA